MLTILTAENLRTPLGPLLDSVIEKHIAHRLADDFLILTPDENSAHDLIRHFLKDPRLGGVLTGSSILSVKNWLKRIVERQNPSASLAPEWLREKFFLHLAEKHLGEKASAGANEERFSLGSLYPLIQSFRHERMGPEAVRAFVAGFDPPLADACFSLAKDYFKSLNENPILHDDTWLENEALRLLEKNQTEFARLKTLYWLGFSHTTPLLKTLLGTLENLYPHLEQILLFQTPRQAAPEDWIASQWGEKKEVYLSKGEPVSPPQIHFHEFPGPFDEAGFILENLSRLVEEGAQPDTLAVFLPPDPFWETYFSSELEKRGLFSHRLHLRKLASFARVADTCDKPPEEAEEKTLKFLEELRSSFQKLPTREKGEEDALEIRALSQWKEILEELLFYRSSLPEIFETPLPLLRIAQTTFLAEKPPSPSSVRLRRHKEAGLQTFSHVFAFQLIDRALPQGPERFFGFSLPDASRLLATERSQFQHLLGAANRTLDLSTSSHGAQSEENSASPFLTEFGFENPEKRRHYPFLAAKEEKKDFETRLRVEALRNRQPDYRHPYGGLLQNPETLRRLEERLQNHAFSPSQLENYARCPFQFFAATLLKLKAPQDQPPEGNAAERGEWLHQFLEKFFRENRDALLKSVRAPHFQEEILNRIPSALQNLSEEFLKEKPWIDPLLSNDFMGRAAGAASALVKDFWEKAALSDRPFLPAYFERSFGKADSPPLFFERPGAPSFKVAGRVDRIDVTADGREFFVFDYKTGETNGISDDIQRFKGFQLPLYLLAAKQILKTLDPASEPEGLGALALSLKDLSMNEGLLKDEVKKRIGFKGRKALFKEEEWESFFRDFEEKLFQLQKRLRSGDFRTAPDPCSAYCEFRTICRYHEREKTHR
ncbi:MAG: PD-(D/E)XK nuclease family protein [bacterium]